MSRIFSKKLNLNRGFTLLELIVAIAIFAILCSITIPAYSSWLPDYELRNAARDLYSTMRLAKTLAVKQNTTYQIIFDTSGKGSYKIVRPDNTIAKVVSFSTYDPSGGIRYGNGKATKNTSGGPLKPDGVSYVDNTVSFFHKGTTGLGYVYLENRKGAAYAIGTWMPGTIGLKKWDENKKRWI
jgi:prepilin-type N-terminal cleavage/methylation domain-containing protein